MQTLNYTFLTFEEPVELLHRKEKFLSFHSKHIDVDNFSLSNSAHKFVYMLNDVSVTLMRAGFIFRNIPKKTKKREIVKC